MTRNGVLSLVLVGMILRSWALFFLMDLFWRFLALVVQWWSIGCTGMVGDDTIDFVGPETRALLIPEPYVTYRHSG